jgi:predicted DNA-binding transcriptional regulator AlpA
MSNNDQGRAPAYSPSDLLNEREAARYLNLAPATLRNWRAAKKGPLALKIGKRATRYRFADLEEFIAASTKAVS